VPVGSSTGAVSVGKLLTTPKEPAQGVVTLLLGAAARAEDTATLIHGTTLATNARIERKGAKAGLLTTAGVRDAIGIGRDGRYDMCDVPGARVRVDRRLTLLAEPIA
jgi:N-methylhydantoinase A